MRIPEFLAVVKFNLNMLIPPQLTLQLNLDLETPILEHSPVVLEPEKPIPELLEAVTAVV